MGIPLSGTTLDLATAAPGSSGFRTESGLVCKLHSKPRSNCQLGIRFAPQRTHHNSKIQSADSPVAADAGYADALPGPGIRSHDAVPLFRRPSQRSCRLVEQGRAEFLEQFPNIAFS